MFDAIAEPAAAPRVDAGQQLTPDDGATRRQAHPLECVDQLIEAAGLASVDAEPAPGAEGYHAPAFTRGADPLREHASATVKDRQAVRGR